MSSKESKKKLTPEERAERDAKAMESARRLRERREAVRGEAPIDRDIHLSLPLTRVFVPLILLTLVMYGVTRFAMSSHNTELFRISGIATTVLFITAFVVWFVSRHQAKKLTEEMRGPKEQSDEKSKKKLLKGKRKGE